MFAMLDGKKPLELVEVEEVREIPMVAYVTEQKVYSIITWVKNFS